MKTVLVCNQKGGVGKSLIADEISFAFERDGVIANHRADVFIRQNKKTEQ